MSAKVFLHLGTRPAVDQSISRLTGKNLHGDKLDLSLPNMLIAENTDEGQLRHNNRPASFDLGTI